MDSYTVKHLYNDLIDQDKHYGVYVCYDGDGVPLYVGQSRDPSCRIDDHLGYGIKSKPSQLGDAIIRNLPASGDWRVDLYQTEDRQLLERELIKTLSPVLNVALNESPQRSRYVDDIPLEEKRGALQSMRIPYTRRYK